MSETRRGLGKGLGALISERQSTTAATSLADDTILVYQEIAPSLITPNPRQPRTVFDEDDMAELAHSIRQIGLLQPVVVRPVTSGRTPFELVAGERRWRACQEVGLELIPVIVRPTDDTDLLRDALLENLHRAQLNPLDEAAAYQQLLADFGGTQEELATRLGRSRPQVANTLRLLKLPPSVQRSVASGVLSAGHARALLGLGNEEQITGLAQRIIAEGLSVRSVEEIVLLTKNDPDAGPRRKGASKAPSGPMVDAQLAVSTRLGDRLDTRVSLSGARTPHARGKLIIEFADLDDLLRILAELDPPDDDQ
ncbi:MAG: ParB/RepB/Spo0J family partition protein [Candidatus Nanopelagicales bacterium]